jgi:prepilin-type N-terminal cleavage/methylation domain-containing protein
MQNRDAAKTAPGSRSERPRRASPPSPSRQPKRFRGAGPRGFTLLEVVLSMALAGLGVLGLAGLLKVLGDVETEDTWATKALFCAQQGLEEIMYEVSVGARSTGEGEENLEVGCYRGMSRMWAVEPASVLDGLLAVSVECTCDAEGERGSVRLSSLVFREG